MKARRLLLMLFFAIGCGGQLNATAGDPSALDVAEVTAVPPSDCGGIDAARTAPADPALSGVNILRATRPADAQTSPAYTSCNDGAIDRADLRWKYDTTAPAATTVRFFYEKCVPDANDPLDPAKCIAPPATAGNCAKAPQPSPGHYEKTQTDVYAAAGEKTTWRIRPVHNSGGAFSYGRWVRSNTLAEYNFKIRAPEFSLQDYRTKVPWFASLLSTLVSLPIPGIKILNNINLNPVLGLFNKGTLFVRCNDPRFGYILITLPNQQHEMNGLYECPLSGGSIVISLPAKPLGITGISQPNYGCYDNRFKPNVGYTEVYCPESGPCTQTKHEPNTP